MVPPAGGGTGLALRPFGRPAGHAEVPGLAGGQPVRPGRAGGAVHRRHGQSGGAAAAVYAGFHGDRRQPVDLGRVPGDALGMGLDVGPGGQRAGLFGRSGQKDIGFFAKTVEKTLFKSAEMVYNNENPLEEGHRGQEGSEAP